MRQGVGGIKRNSEFRRANYKTLLFDFVSWILATPLSFIIRFDGELRLLKISEILSLAILGFVIHLSFSLLFGTIKRFGKITSFEYLLLSFIIFSGTAITLFLVRITLEFPDVPRSIPILATILSFIFHISSRIITSQWILITGEKNPRNRTVLIYGAGQVGFQIAEQLLNFKDHFTILGFIDDDFKKYGSKILGYKIIGSIEDLETIFRFFRPSICIVAISNIQLEKIKRVSEISQDSKVEVRIVPKADNIVSGLVTLSDIETLNDELIMGRPQALQENLELANILKKSKVLVTGAAGSIGSEIVRQLYKYGAGEVILFDRDENGLLRLKLELNHESDLKDSDVILGDVRDYEHVLNVIQRTKPDFVFHAAALKHISTLERFPDEAIKTNVNGTRNVWKASLESNVPYLVNISSDKAADPTTQLGKTKLSAERIIASTPEKLGIEKYISVRFGNVIGSNGSFVEIFRYQIEKGGPLTVRDPEATRYFMTIKEAVHLVLEALVVGSNRETLILDMGEPVKILDVAKQMIRATGKSVEIIFTGLNPGEKLHEILYSENEKIQFKSHPKIMHTMVEPLKESEI